MVFDWSANVLACFGSATETFALQSSPKHKVLDSAEFALQNPAPLLKSVTGCPAHLARVPTGGTPVPLSSSEKKK